ncbi:MAG: hypothetical protein HQL31_03805 [Planctomycetes bacterium]|nr:hypothetical protein [Planctomycetota bacterium]
MHAKIIIGVGVGIAIGIDSELTPWGIIESDPDSDPDADLDCGRKPASFNTEFRVCVETRQRAWNPFVVVVSAVYLLSYRKYGIMTPEKPWLSTDEFLTYATGRELIFWGCFDNFEKTMELGELKPCFLVDSSQNVQGRKAHHGFDVLDPSVLEDREKHANRYIVITTTAIYEVMDILIAYGYEPGRDFCVSPILGPLRVISEIFHLKTRLLISCSDMARPRSPRGGGIYLLDTSDGNLERKLSGITRGFLRHQGHYYIHDASRGLLVTDLEFKVEAVIELPQMCYPHGMALDMEGKRILCVFTRQDRIAMLDLATRRFVDECAISDKYFKTGTYHHHINDICVHERYMYLSLFSCQGLVQENIFDNGAIMRIHLDDLNDREVLVEGLWQPHTVKHIDGKLGYLDSMRGNVHLGRKEPLAQFSGYIRGLDYDGRYYYIGQSAHRYLHRLEGHMNNISMDCGIYVFDPDSRASRLILTPGIRDINTLSIADEDLGER